MAADSNSQLRHHEFYFVAYPFVQSPELKSAEREFADNRRKCSQITDVLRTKRAELNEVREKLRPLIAEEIALNQRREEIRNRLSELGFNFTNVRNRANPDPRFSSEADIDQEVRRIGSQAREDIDMARISTRELHHVGRVIRELEESRGTLLSLEDVKLNRRLKQIRDEKKELRDMEYEISALQNERDSYTQYMDEASPRLHQLRYQNNELCLQMRAQKEDAIFNYRVNPNPSALEDRSKQEVEKFMKRWNENSEFRDDYEKRQLTAAASS